MGFTGDCCLVRCKLDDEELLCQLAEEAVELSMAAGAYAEGYFEAYCLGSEEELINELVEEMADVELVVSILLKKEEAEELQETYKMAHFTESDLRNTQAVSSVIRDDCMEVAKAALKLRRAMGNKNPTTMSETEARVKLMGKICGSLPVVRALYQKFDSSNKVADIKVMKAQRWAQRLTGGMGNEGVYEDRPEFLGK